MLSDGRLPPVERLRQHFEFLASRYKGFGYDKGCLVGNLAAECSDNMPLVRKALKQVLTGWTKAVSGVIREGQANGSISPDRHPEELARFLVNSWEGAVVRMKIVNSRQPLDDFFAVALPLVTSGHGIRSAKGARRKAPTKRAKRKRWAGTPSRRI
jgi:TetR/AcrR family transcriptional repressor of nem operon